MTNNDVDINNIIDNIRANKPILIKKFLLKYNFDKTKLIEELKNIETSTKQHYAPGVYNKDVDNFDFIKKIKSDLNIDNNLIYKNNTRYWIHPKNNFTPNHYDGDGFNVINICIKGKKNLFYHHQIQK